MLVRFSLLVRLLTVSSLAAPVIAWSTPVHAQDDEDDDEGEGDEGEGEEEEEDAEDKDQPPVTAGGLYTIETYPQSEVERPLTITQKVFEARVGIGFDLTKNQTFDRWILDLRLRYGLRDNIELQAGADPITIQNLEGVSGGHSFFFGGEIAIVYDLVDFRLNGIVDVATVAEGADSDTNFDLAFGFPFKYRLKSNVAIIALDKLFTIHTDGRDPDLTVGVGGVFQVAPPFAVVARGEFILKEFEEDLKALAGTVAAQFSPSGRFDLGAEFVLGNLLQEDRQETPDEEGPFDARLLRLYGRLRF